MCFCCCKDLFKKRRELLDSLHNVNSDLSSLCRPNQTTHRKDQGSIAVKKGVDCANSVENIVAEKNSIRTNLVRTSQDLFLAQHQEKSVGARQYM